MQADPVLHVTCALIERNGLLFAARRSERMPLAGLWEFPGGKLQEGEGLEDCILREVREELGITIRIRASFTPVPIQAGDGAMLLHPFLCEIVAGEPILAEHAEAVWGTYETLKGLDFAPADAAILEEYKAFCRTRTD